MSRHIYKYHLNLPSILWSVAHIIIFIALSIMVYTLYESGFISAWFLSFIIAITLLLSLSIPRFIEIDDDVLRVNCLLDITEINIEDIIIIRKIAPRRLRWVVPIFGSRGFFGYYGHYFDIRHFRRVVIYASQWQNLIEIVDVYEDHYYISSEQRDELIAQVRELQK